MDLIKHLEFFNPVDIRDPIHIIGLGAIGSHLAMQLTRLGCDDLYLYDFDKVESKNVANQIYYAKDRDEEKTVATYNNLQMINPDVRVHLFAKGYTHQPLAGYVFLAVDSIDVRRDIATANQYNPMIKAMFDFRMGLADAQHYACNWKSDSLKKNFLDSMAFTREEAKEAQPVSACGTTLSVLPTIEVITALGISNFINHVKGKPLRSIILIDAFSFDLITM